MKVLFVTRKYPPRVGGMEDLSYHLTSGWPGPKTIIALGRRQWHLVWFLPYAALRVLATARRYDLVHVGDPLLAIVAWIARKCGRPVALNVHGLDLTYASPWYQAYLRLFLTADIYVAISQSTFEIARQRGLSPVEIIPVGVDDAYFQISPVARTAGPLLTIGRLVPRKGIAWFVEEVLPRLRLPYVIIGDGPEETVIRQAAHRAGLANRVQVLGQVSKSEKIRRLAEAKAFVMPNIRVPNDVEGFGIVALEAAAAGLPVVAARLEGIQDAVIDGENGVLVEPKNPVAFASAIQKIFDHPEASGEAGQRARAYTKKHYAWPVILRRYQAVFARLIDESK